MAAGTAAAPCRTRCIRRESNPNAAITAADCLERFEISEIDSVGGVSVVMELINPNRKSAIKYLEATATVYNAVGDMLISDIHRRAIANLQFTGPWKWEQGPRKAEWGPVWYASTARCVRITSVTVIFMDGKTQRFNGAAVKNALAPGLKNDCKPN